MGKLKKVFEKDYLRRNLIVAVVVGSLLTLINQPEALLGEQAIVWWKVALTYVVPFGVATYGAWGALPEDQV